MAPHGLLKVLWLMVEEVFMIWLVELKLLEQFVAHMMLEIQVMKHLMGQAGRQLLI